MFKRSFAESIAGLRNLIFLFIALYARASWACWAPPAQQLMSVDEQVRLATDVSVAKVISATPLKGEDVEYRFLVLQRLAGPDRAVFTVTGGAGAPYGKDTTFDNHMDPAFWKRGGGRVMNDSDCVIHPGFVVGNSYLVFLGSPVTWRSFEKIEVVNGTINAGDKWLAYLEARLGRRGFRHAVASAPAGG